jgi:hypothetical protein
MGKKSEHGLLGLNFATCLSYATPDQQLDEWAQSGLGERAYSLCQSAQTGLVDRRRGASGAVENGAYLSGHRVGWRLEVAREQEPGALYEAGETIIWISSFSSVRSGTGNGSFVLSTQEQEASANTELRLPTCGIHIGWRWQPPPLVAQWIPLRGVNQYDHDKCKSRRGSASDRQCVYSMK